MIKDNVLEIKRRIASACARAKRSSEEVTIVVVSKTRSIEEIQEVIAAGITDIGENRVQEAVSKYNSLQPQAKACVYSLQLIKWHMVGHLQTNKVKEAVKIFDLIQSVDSLNLASEINKEAGKINKTQDILLEVKTSPEESKFGLKPGEAVEVIKEIAQLKNVNIRGLMTIAPVVGNPEKARPYFRQLKELRDTIAGLQPQAKACAYSLSFESLELLSMGMSDDFEVAIEEGANMVRLGRVIFEGWKAE